MNITLLFKSSLLLLFSGLLILPKASSQVWPMHEKFTEMPVGLEEFPPGSGIKKRIQKSYSPGNRKDDQPNLHFTNWMTFDQNGNKSSHRIKYYWRDYTDFFQAFKNDSCGCGGPVPINWPYSLGGEPIFTCNEEGQPLRQLIPREGLVDTVFFEYDPQGLPLYIRKSFSKLDGKGYARIKVWSFSYDKDNHMVANQVRELRVHEKMFGKLDSIWEMKGFEYRVYEKGQLVQKRYGVPVPTCSYMNDPICWDTLWENYTYDEKGRLEETRGPDPYELGDRWVERVLRYQYNKKDLVTLVEEFEIIEKKRGREEKKVAWAEYEYEYW